MVVVAINKTGIKISDYHKSRDQKSSLAGTRARASGP
eukprot:COSAG06_NODE_69065_length_199_cov_17.610000_1_plen_36_part_10